MVPGDKNQKFDFFQFLTFKGHLRSFGVIRGHPRSLEVTRCHLNVIQGSPKPYNYELNLIKNVYFWALGSQYRSRDYVLGSHEVT